jgi:hypothetical protein
MGGTPLYEANPSPHFLAVLRATIPGFEPTPDGWFEVERELKRRLQIRDRAGYSLMPAEFLLGWREDDVLRVLDPAVSPFPEVRDRFDGRPAKRPAFPLFPLDPSCVAPAPLSAGDKAEVVRLVCLVQTDFAPEKDPRGWDSVAELVRGSGRPADEVRKMGYDELAAFFRVRHNQLKIQLGGAIETNTPSIVSYNAVPPAQASPRGYSTRAIDVDGPLGKIETKMRKTLEAELGSEVAAAAALADKLYSLSSEDLEPMLRKVGCKADPRTIRRNSKKYEAWKRYRRPAPSPDIAVDVGPAVLSDRSADGEDAAGDTLRRWRRNAGLSDVRPSAADAAADAIDAGQLSKRSGGRGTTRIGKTVAEKAAEDAADRFAREAGVDLPPAE